MWQIHAMIALDLARERAREAQSAADHQRLLNMLAAERAPRGRAPGRAMLATLLRRVSGGADAIAEAACRAASRLDGQTA